VIAKDRIDLGEPRRLHLLGVGGSGMAPFARLLKAEGHAITGADARDGATVQALRRQRIPVLCGTEADLLPAGTEAVIHSAAIPGGAAPLDAARGMGLPVLKYARAVGLYAHGRRTCAVAGTHGKTTTTALLAHVLRRGGLRPGYLVGGAVPQLPAKPEPKAQWFVVEACEYDRSFLHLHPEVAIVTNIEPEHLDYYRDIVEIRDAFQAFARQVSDLLVLHESLRDDLGRAGGIRARVVTFGPSPDADVRVFPADRRRGLNAFATGDRTYRMKLPGFHNVLNAAAVLAVARSLGLDDDVFASALATFRGTCRRLQVVGRPGGVSVVDDYAHHPTEVAAGLQALRDAYAPRRLWVVFQPHQYSRLRRFLPDFARALAKADRIVVPDIFAARDADEDRRSVHSTDLVAAVQACGAEAVHISAFAAIVDFVRTQARAGDVVVTMGAGDVGDVAGRLAATL